MFPSAWHSMQVVLNAVLDAFAQQPERRPADITRYLRVLICRMYFLLQTYLGMDNFFV